MKRILYIIPLLLMASCGTPRLAERIVSIGFADYRPYTSSDFFISPNAYNQEYDPIGEIFIEITPEQVYKQVGPDYYGNTTTQLGWADIPYQELLELAVKEAQDRGADALVNFSIKKVSKPELYLKYGDPELYPHYEISGFCIKRK